MIAIFCLVHGEPIANAFSVKIPRSDTVSDLKKLIKDEKKNDFHDIDADKLKLWSVSIPVDDTSALEDFVLEDNEEKGVQELLPTDDIADVFSTPLKKHIHVIVERPLCIAADSLEVQQLRAQLKALQEKVEDSVHFFKIFVGRKRTPLTWPINLETMTRDRLKNDIFTYYKFGTEFNIEDTSLDFTIYDTKEKCAPVDDVALRSMLRKMVSRNMFQLSVQLSTPSKAYSSYNLSAVCQLYGLGDGSDASLAMFPELECGHISGDIYEQDLAKFMTTLEEHLSITPFDGTNEATKSVYVYLFLHAAVSIFGASAFTICLEKDITGAHGHGSVDYAIDSRRLKRTVGVTEVKDENFKQGIAQNAVQLESCLSRKRKADEMEDDETFVGKAFGIVSDAEKFYFLECRLNGDGKPSFKLSNPVIVDYRSSFKREMVTKVLGHIGWLLEEAEKPESPSMTTKKQRIM